MRTEVRRSNMGDTGENQKVRRSNMEGTGENQKVRRSNMGDTGENQEVRRADMGDAGENQEVRRADMGDAGENQEVRRSNMGDSGENQEVRRSNMEGTVENRALISGRGASAPESAIISTFTSAQEREALRRALAKGRHVIQIIPQGIPPESELPPDLLAACRDGRALLLSPQPPHSRLNKKVATWCNEYVLRHADEIWAGDISPNGMLAAMLKSLGRY